MADLTISFLEELGVLPAPEKRHDHPLMLPAEALLELGPQVLRITSWEDQGYSPFLTTKLPTAKEALCSLAERMRHNPASFRCEQEPPPLLVTVLDTAMRDFAWNGRSEWGCDVLVGPIDDEEAALDAFAAFIWAQRHAGPDNLISESCDG